MPYNRKAIAPWSTERLQGIESATVDSNIETPQYLQPVVHTGVINKNGNWIGNVTSDRNFTIDATHEAVANGASVLSPQAQPDFIDMTGYTDLFIALFVTDTGNYAIDAVMGPDTNTFANLTPVNAAATLRGKGTGGSMIDLFVDSSEAMTTGVWNIYYIHTNLAGQKNMQFKITNNAGSESNITFAYLRVV